MHGTDTRDLSDTIAEIADDRPIPSDSEEVTDRGVIIGRDGRWAAGWALRFIIMVVAGYLALQLLGKVWVGLLPILLAILVTSVLWPVTSFFRNTLRFPAALAAIATIIGFFAAIIGVFAAMAPTVRDQGASLVTEASNGIDRISKWIQDGPFDIDLGQFSGALDDVVNYVRQQSANIASGVFSGLSAATSVVVTLVVMLVLTFFFLKDGSKFLPWVRKYTGSNVGWHLTEVLTRTWNTLAGFIRTQALVSLVDAVFIGIGLLILGVPLALVLAVITFFAGFIPIVGAFTAGALAVIIALVTNGLTNALLVLALIILVQQIEGNILQPILQSKAMNLHAAVVLLSVTVGSTMFGIVGAFLAVPVAATIAVWFRYHSEMVALRAGEISIDDIEIATKEGTNVTSKEAFEGVRDKLRSMGRRRNEDSAEGKSESGGILPRFRKVVETEPE